eukprot:CAMPEP_0179322808 /NCGR_PEP_ID=MMETSP0797-20121207/59375_1 /TAXON_ID=47934 /ORGANISM="Dinophysis acuminata, Strain DAEP01" /LENGTH=165 /DNA_ID=CAMNT_0021034589 /DNA_START=66 /DNA_END=561 /DNA_ORIENTATION=+
MLQSNLGRGLCCVLAAICAAPTAALLGQKPGRASAALLAATTIESPGPGPLGEAGAAEAETQQVEAAAAPRLEVIEAERRVRQVPVDGDAGVGRKQGGLPPPSEFAGLADPREEKAAKWGRSDMAGGEEPAAKSPQPEEQDCQRPLPQAQQRSWPPPVPEAQAVP